MQMYFLEYVLLFSSYVGFFLVCLFLLFSFFSLLFFFFASCGQKYFLDYKDGITFRH